MTKVTVTKLKKIDNLNDLQKETRKIILNNSYDYDDLEDWFNDLFSHGCQSGMVSELIYYTDTHEFAKKHIEEILALKTELEDDMGETIQDRNKGDELNFLAWLAFEETARQLYHLAGGENW